MAHLASLAAACTHGGFTPTMTTDPRLVSRAIFEWWWTDPRAANQSGPRQRRRGHGDAANAHATVSRHLPEHNGQRGRVEDLSMDSLHVGDESDGHGGQGARDLVGNAQPLPSFLGPRHRSLRGLSSPPCGPD